MKQKEKKTESRLKKGVLDFGEYADRFLTRAKYSDIEQSLCEDGITPRNGGLLRMPMLDGAGRSSFRWVFAGNVRQESQERPWSETHDLTVGLTGGLGGNNLKVEAKLRRHKQQEGYTEVKTHGGKRRGAGRKKSQTEANREAI